MSMVGIEKLIYILRMLYNEQSEQDQLYAVVIAHEHKTSSYEVLFINLSTFVFFHIRFKNDT